MFNLGRYYLERHYFILILFLFKYLVELTTDIICAQCFYCGKDLTTNLTYLADTELLMYFVLSEFW